MPKKRSSSINLIKDSKDNFFDKFIDWALTIGRVVVIFTEIVALSAFIYRFTLDRQLIDLHSKIKQEAAIVSSFKNQEETYRNLQDRLKIASDFSSGSQNKITMFQDIVGLMSKGMTFNTLTISENSINIDANFQNSSSLGNFVSSLKSYKHIDNVSIDRIENRLSNAEIIVTITAALNKNQ